MINWHHSTSMHYTEGHCTVYVLVIGNSFSLNLFIHAVDLETWDHWSHHWTAGHYNVLDSWECSCIDIWLCHVSWNPLSTGKFAWSRLKDHTPQNCQVMETLLLHLALDWTVQQSSTVAYCSRTARHPPLCNANPPVIPCQLDRTVISITSS